MKLMINQGKDMLITDGLIMKKKKIASMSGRREMVPTWFEEKPKEKGSALEESGVEAGGNQEETGVAPKRQA
jgi:hypothetical protein